MKKKSNILILKLATVLFGSLFFLVDCQQSGTTEAGETTNETELRGGNYYHLQFTCQSRGIVSINVYLPPGWTQNGSETYPLLIFLHGNGLDENYFPNCVPSQQLNTWINQNLVRPMVIVTPNGWEGSETHEWFTPNNINFITSNNPNDLMDYCRVNFRAGLDSKTTSIQGHSRGASGALYFLFNYPQNFASVIANAFVSDYLIDDLEDMATQYYNEIINSDICLRMSIGAGDEYVLEYKRSGTSKIHEHLETLSIPHEYEILPDADHEFKLIWNSVCSSGQANGLYELQYHALAWETQRGD